MAELIILRGNSGSGKSTLARRLAADFGSECRYHHLTALIQEDIFDTDRYSVLRQSFSKRRLFTPFIMLCPLKKPLYGIR